MPQARGTRLRAAARRLVVDRTTAELVAALGAVGIESIVLKGPSFGHWIYGEHDQRQYADSDLLVAPGDMDAARAVLIGLGFDEVLREADNPDRRQVHAQAWARRGHPVPVDLHRTLHGARIPAGEAWTVLRRHTRTLRIDRVDATIFDRDATALHVALHAAQHGRGEPHVQRDLAAALERFDRDTWEAAAELAERLRATPAFAAGLRLHARGKALAAELRLSEDRPFDVALLALTPARGAHSIHAVATAGGARRKLTLLLRLLVPAVAFMRHTSPLARRGRLGLVAAYLSRPFVLAYAFVPAVRALRQASRQSR